MLRAIPTRPDPTPVRPGGGGDRPRAVGASFRFTAKFIRVRRLDSSPRAPSSADPSGADPTRPDPSLRAHSGAPTGGRLNLLLSHGGWQQESWADRLPVLLEPLGVQSMRVGSGREATNVLQRNPVHIAVVDLTLPLDAADAPGAACTWPGVGAEEGGPRLLQLLSRLAAPPPTVVVRAPRSSRDDTRLLCEALRGGIFAVVDRPVNLELMLEVFRRALRRHYSDRWPSPPLC